MSRLLLGPEGPYGRCRLTSVPTNGTRGPTLDTELTPEHDEEDEADETDKFDDLVDSDQEEESEDDSSPEEEPTPEDADSPLHTFSSTG